MKTMNNQNTEQEKKENKMPLPTQAALFFRGFAGFYLLYLVYQMFTESTGEEPQAVIIIFSIIFVAIGIFLLFITIRGFLRGEYIGGKADTSEEEESEVVEENEVLEESTALEESTPEENA